MGLVQSIRFLSTVSTRDRLYTVRSPVAIVFFLALMINIDFSGTTLATLDPDDSLSLKYALTCR